MLVGPAPLKRPGPWPTRLERVDVADATCERCGEQFVTRYPWQRFCSKSCANRRYVPRTCKHCATEFTGRQGQDFCSKSCAVTVQQAIRRAKRSEPTVRPCGECREPTQRGKYCSRECAARARWGWCDRCDEKHPYDRHTCAGLVRRPPVLEGERRIRKDGYVKTRRNGVVGAEHRLVMAELLGRPLLTSETPHHINGDRADNRPTNLELWNTSQPPGQRVEDKVAWAREILDLYGDKFEQPRLRFEDD